MIKILVAQSGDILVENVLCTRRDSYVLAARFPNRCTKTSIETPNLLATGTFSFGVLVGIQDEPMAIQEYAPEREHIACGRAIGQPTDDGPIEQSRAQRSAQVLGSSCCKPGARQQLGQT